MNYSTVLQDIKSNLKSQRDRLAQAHRNLCFYHHGYDDLKRFDANNFDTDKNNLRMSWFMRQVVAIQSRDLYRQAPLRLIPENDAATEWLAQVYKQNAMWAKWPEADRLSSVGDVAWFGVGATGNPHDPLRINLYGADQIAAWEDDEDPTKIKALAVISDVEPMLADEQIARKYTLWTPEEIQVWVSKGNSNTTLGAGQEPYLVSTEPNPYGLIPFTSVHNEYPTTTIWTTGPGNYLYRCNKYINWELTQIANLIRSNPPMKVLSGADANWTPPTPMLPQDFLQIPGSVAGKDGQFKYEPSNLGFVEPMWQDLQNFIDHSLECLGVPPAAYRQIESSAKSGAAMMAEQTSLIETAKSRQMPFSHYEEHLAWVCFAVYQAYYGKALVDLEDFSLTIKWPNFWPDLPGPERDRADQWDLDNDILSLVMLLQKRDKLTREEAIAHLEQVAEDKEEQVKILGEEPAPVVVMGGDGMSPGDLPDGEQDSESNED